MELNAENNKSSIVLYWGIFALVCSFFVFLNFEFPRSVDDWIFLEELYYAGCDADGHHNLWTGIKECIKIHYLIDNSRIGNTIATAMLLAPEWINSAIAALMFCIAFSLMTRLSRINPGENIKLAFLSIFVIFGIMWQEHLFTHMYAYNYTIIIPLYLYAIMIVCEARPRNIFFGFFIGLIIGSWHESFGAATFASTVALMIFKPSLRQRDKYFRISGIALGSLWLVCFKGFEARLVNSIILDNGIKHPFYLYMVFVALFSAIVCLFTKHWRNVFKEPLLICTFASAFTIIPPLLLVPAARAGLPAILLSCCLMIVFMQLWWPNAMNGHNLGFRICAISIFCFAIVHMVFFCMETFRLRHNLNDLMQQSIIVRGTNKNIFTDVSYPWDNPWILANRPHLGLLLPGHYEMIGLRIFMHDHTIKDPIPIELKDYSGQGEPLAGNGDFMIWKDRIISPKEIKGGHHRGYVKYRWYETESEIVVLPFTTSAGKTYRYILPIRSQLTFFTGNPIEITLYE